VELQGIKKALGEGTGDTRAGDLAPLLCCAAVVQTL
jgi:hypothetical protein